MFSVKVARTCVRTTHARIEAVLVCVNKNDHVLMDDERDLGSSTDDGSSSISVSVVDKLVYLHTSSPSVCIKVAARPEMLSSENGDIPYKIYIIDGIRLSIYNINEYNI